ncbi:MAG: DHA2 family efflux MFS transporter permease subunit [Neisseria sp.]|uniref:DHA2 family efflux MFS transporter permease subunit n=1 Tax=Neisseria sp. TaxID=192066 RepID=UPI0026DA898B|nr:DHA2 family efflux MFS transporter permease subunit [Neisseria sp.]MDO4641178.1 DHA2 family efflux MFS transporter permease subunit [Neisseria sp.]
MTSSKPHKHLPFLLALSIFMQMLDATILNTALPKMALDLHESPLNMQSAVISYALTLALLMPLSGYLCDRYGTRKVFAVAMGLFVAGSLMAAAAPNLNMLVIARVVQGMGGSMLMPVPRLVVIRAYEKNRLLSVMNYIIMPALLGPVLGPLVGGYLVEYANWHWIFLINVPIGAIGILLTLKILPDFYSPENKVSRFDVSGFLLFAAGAVLLSFAMETLTRPGAYRFAIAAAIPGIIAFWLYLQHAKHNEQALYPLHLIQVRTFRLGISGNLACRLGMAAVPFLLPLLLQVVFGKSPAESGWTLAPIALAALLTKPLVKPLIERAGYRNTLIWNTRIIGVVIMLLSFPTAQTPFWLLIPLLFFLGMCNSLQYSAMNTLTIADLRPQQTGSGNSLMTVNQQLAISLGIALGALLLNRFSIPEISNGDLHNAFRYTFWVIGAITFASAQIFTHLHKYDGGNLTEH